MAELKVGDRVFLTGGYEWNAPWLCGKDGYYGHILAFVACRKPTVVRFDDRPLAVVKLDEPISFWGITGNILIMELRYWGTTWRETETVQVHLLETPPKGKLVLDHTAPSYVESHATYKIVQN